MKYDLSVIVTCSRHALLPLCLEQLKRQSVANLRVETVVIIETDAIDWWLFEHTLKRYGVENDKYAIGPISGTAGASARNAGLTMATGDYVVFWDDDNVYYDHALATLYATAYGYDVGIVSAVVKNLNDFVIRHPADLFPANPYGFTPIPRESPTVKSYDIDTMCLCVRREVANLAPWPLTHDHNDTGWLKEILSHPSNPTLRHVPVQIGIHI